MPHLSHPTCLALPCAFRSLETCGLLPVRTWSVVRGSCLQKPRTPVRRAGWEPHPVGRVRAGPWGVSGRLRVSAPHPQPHPGLSPARLQMKWGSRGPGPHSGGGRGHQRWVRAPLCVCHGQNLDQEVVAWFRLVTTGACPVFHSRAMLSSGGSSLQSVGPSRHPWQEPPLSPQASPALPGHPLHPRHPPDAPSPAACWRHLWMC